MTSASDYIKAIYPPFSISRRGSRIPRFQKSRRGLAAVGQRSMALQSVCMQVCWDAMLMLHSEGRWMQGGIWDLDRLGMESAEGRFYYYGPSTVKLKKKWNMIL